MNDTGIHISSAHICKVQLRDVDEEFASLSECRDLAADLNSSDT